MSEFNTSSWPTANKLHKCVWCGENILVGEKHYRYVGKFEDDFQCWRMHLECETASAEGRSEGFTPHGNERPAHFL